MRPRPAKRTDRFETARAFQSVARELGRDVEQLQYAPALAKCAAICAPIVPAPSIATDRIDDICNMLHARQLRSPRQPPPIKLLNLEHRKARCHEHPSVFVERHVIR